MTMDRAELMQLIKSGRSLAFNCYDIGSHISPDDGNGKLFTNKELNNSLIFKTMERDFTGETTVTKMRTLIYFPYNLDNVGEGGDSILLDDPGFHAALQLKTGMDAESPEGQAEYGPDLEVLEMVRSLPTFDPFLLKSKAQQLDLHDRIHPDYLNISEEDWVRIRRPIRQKIRKLVERALVGENKDADMDAIEKYVSLFLDKIWEAQDIEGIEDFVASLDIPADQAPDLFFAWKAICFYESEFAGAQTDIVRFFKWLGNDEVAQPSNWAQLHAEEKLRFEHSIDCLRTQVRSSYRDIKSVLDTYENSYQKFLKDGQPTDFKNFLANAESHYVKLAANLSANLHGVKIWGFMIDKLGERLAYEKSTELLSTLSGLFDVPPAPLYGTQLAS
jgi:hypothetical protein